MVGCPRRVPKNKPKLKLKLLFNNIDNNILFPDSVIAEGVGLEEKGLGIGYNP